jgi:hypothetical protein
MSRTYHRTSAYWDDVPKEVDKRRIMRSKNKGDKENPEVNSMEAELFIETIADTTEEILTRVNTEMNPADRFIKNMQRFEKYLITEMYHPGETNPYRILREKEGEHPIFSEYTRERIKKLL